MDWNNNGKVDAGDYAHYKMMTESSNQTSANKSSQIITTSDSGLKILLIVIIVSIVYAVLEAMGAS